MAGNKSRDELVRSLTLSLEAHKLSLASDTDSSLELNSEEKRKYKISLKKA